MHGVVDRLTVNMSWPSIFSARGRPRNSLTRFDWFRILSEKKGPERGGAWGPDRYTRDRIPMRTGSYQAGGGKCGDPKWGAEAVIYPLLSPGSSLTAYAIK